MADIVQIADIKNDNTLITPLETLKDIIRRIESGDLNPDKLLVLALTTELNGEGGYYHINGFTSNMHLSEEVALLGVRHGSTINVLLGDDNGR